MQTIQQTISPGYLAGTQNKSLVKRFFNWSDQQEKFRFGWLAAILAVHGCVLAPITLFIVFMSGNNAILWTLVISAMALALITNLAAMPTKITVPVFFLTVLIDLGVIVASLAM